MEKEKEKKRGGGLIMVGEGLDLQEWGTCFEAFVGSSVSVRNHPTFALLFHHSFIITALSIFQHLHLGPANFVIRLSDFMMLIGIKLPISKSF